MKSKNLDISLPPSKLYELINEEYVNSFLLESTEGEERLARFSLIGFDPKKHIIANGKIVKINDCEEEIDKPIEKIKQNVRNEKIHGEGFFGGAVGYFSYEYFGNIEKVGLEIKKDMNFPDFEFGIFDDCIVYDHKSGTIRYLYENEDRSSQITKLATRNQMDKRTFVAGEIREDIDMEEYCRIVEEAKEHIKSGDIFQVVLSRRYEFEAKGNPIDVYNYLKKTNPSPYMFYLSFGERKVMGASPENLVRVEGNKIDSYATLAGTRPRGKTNEEDKRIENELKKDEKERAEHLMLVDLTRNDIGKIAKVGTVKVNRLMSVTKFSHVQHLSSHIQAELADGNDCYKVFNAIFPAGTLTGAPKIRAIEIIKALEKNSRGPYGGAVGYFSNNGNCDFAITIRSMMINNQKAYIQAGAGIVYDSIPENEFKETENKAKALINALGEINEGSIN